MNIGRNNTKSTMAKEKLEDKKVATLGEVSKIIEDRLGKIEMNDNWIMLSVMMLAFQYKSVEEIEELFDKCMKNKDKSKEEILNDIMKGK